MIDAHVHVWQLGRNGFAWPTPDLAAIYRDFALDDLRGEPGASALEGVVLVQSQESEADTDWLLGLAEADPFILGVVGWTDLAHPSAAEAIAALAARPKLRALRPMVQDRAADWYDAAGLAPAWLAMTAHDLVLDALVRPRHLASLARLAERHPTLEIVVDHAAKPDFASPEPWREGMRRLAALPNVACKLSGLLTELRSGSDPDAVEDSVRFLCPLFGPARLIWGSDWPVLRLDWDYLDWLELARGFVPRAHRPALFSGNARRIYALPASAGRGA
jgi:L-fuconolactonase